MVGMERRELQHGNVEVLNVFGLNFASASGVGLLAFGVPFGGPLGFQFGMDLLGAIWLFYNGYPWLVATSVIWRSTASTV